MKKILFVLAIVVALTFAMTATAFADHSPTFYVEWNPNTVFQGYAVPFGNGGTGSVHAGYFEGTEKCAVCHSVHRAPVPGVKWDTVVTNPAAKTLVAGGQYYRQEFEAPAGATTQLLMQTTVANSCNYCHLNTSIGGDQLFGASVIGGGQLSAAATLSTGALWQAGFAHGNACTGCHVVHGVGSSTDPALYGNGAFQGPIATKALKVRAKGVGSTTNLQLGYVWQDEVIAIGSAGKASLAGSTIPGMAEWAAAQTPADYAGGGWVSQETLAVDPLNVPLFPSATDAINGTNVRPGTNAYDAQSAAFCTFCHQNYGYASEATVNPDGDKSLFQGPWYADRDVVPNVSWSTAYDAEGWTNSNTGGGQTMPFKNHPVKSIDGAFAAAGTAFTGQVAFVGSETCVSCHDAGLNRAGNTGVLVESYPHFTPGYFHFVKSAPYAGAVMSNGPVELGLIPEFLAADDAAGIAAVQAWLDDPINYQKSTTVQDGQCLKCHANTSNTAGIGKTF